MGNSGRVSTQPEPPEHLEFEMYVAFLYESLGFRVERNTNIGGQEVDVLAEKFIPGIGPARVLVECKWRRQGSISNQDVFNFQSTLASLRARNLITRGVMVSNVRFSKDALLAADKSEDMELLQIANLENQLLDLRQVFRSFSERYEQSTIFLSYIRLRGLWATGTSVLKQGSEDIEKTIVDWIDTDRNVSFVTILGDFGAGKTTLLERLKYIYVQRYLSSEGSLIPIFLPLKRLNSYASLEEFVRATLVAEFERDLPLSVFWKNTKGGRFLLLLDGFDEVSAEVDHDKRRENLLRLLPLLHQKSPAILTCRPAYFISTAEYNALVEGLDDFYLRQPSSKKPRQTAGLEKALRQRLLAALLDFEPQHRFEQSGTRTVELEFLSADQVNSFLRAHDYDYRQHCGCGWEDVKEFLFLVYDLKDLMTRPILLTMIHETVLAGEIGVNSPISSLGPARLYELYTSMKLNLDWLKGDTRQLIPKDLRNALAETLALAMFERNTLEISYADLVELAGLGLELPLGVERLRHLQAAVLAADVQTCTFLTRTEDVFRFAHRSFMEFFIAAHLRERIRTDQRDDPIFDRFIPREVLYFVGSFAMPDPEIREILLRWYLEKRPRSTAGHFDQNVAAALLYAGPEQPNLRFRNTILEGVDIYGARFTKPSWSNISLGNSCWRDVQLNEPEFRSVRVINSSVSGLRVRGGELDLDITASQIGNARVGFVRASIRCRNTVVSTATLSDSELRVSGEITVRDAELQRVKVTLGSAVGAGILFANCIFTDSDVALTQSDGILRFKACSFLRCCLFGLRLSLKDFDDLACEDGEGLILLTDENTEFPHGFIRDPRRPRFVLTTEKEIQRPEVVERLQSEISERWNGTLLELAHGLRSGRAESD